jgi:hypothetical protein
MDVLFQDVRAMEIRSWFEGIKIEEVDQKFLEGYPSNPAEMIEQGNKVYPLVGTGWKGFVVGGIMQFKEDDGEAFAPSGLIKPDTKK